MKQSGHAQDKGIKQDNIICKVENILKIEKYA